jgi:putative thioredoxin
MQPPREFSLYGAVDLGARQAALQRRQQQTSRPSGQSAENGATSTPPVVTDVTDETFNTDVVERSRSVPVIVDLWAEWCGPCKQLGPVLEKLAAEAAGRWVLARVDVDANPQLSAALQVQSIPMVVAVIGGQLVDGFLGAMPEAQVREWLSQIMTVAGQVGAGPGQGAQDANETQAGPDAQGSPDGMPPGFAQPGAGPSHPGYAEAQQAMERGDLEAAAAAFEKVLAGSPGDPVAKLGLTQVDLIRRVNSYDQAKARRDAAEHPDDVDAQCRVADIDLATGRIDEAFDRLLGTVRRTTGEERDRARVHLISLFDVFPPRDSRVARARTALSSLLF